MRSMLKLSSFLALMAVGTSGIAQEAEITEMPAEEPAEVTTTDPADGLALGEPVGPRIGEPYIREEFGDWALRCIKTEDGLPDPCNLYQLLLNDDGVAVAEFTLFPLPQGSRAAAGANVIVPLETLLTQQLTLAVDGTNARRYPFTFCNQGGCVARVGFTAEEVEEFKRGANATVRLVPAAAPTEEVILNVSLTGFTAGFERSALLEE